MGHTSAVSYDQARRRHHALRLAILSTVDLLCDRGAIAPICARLVEETPRVAQAEVGALVWTACRWSELNTIDWLHTARTGEVFLSMPKVREQRRAPAAPLEYLPQWEAITDATTLPHHSRKVVSHHLHVAFGRMEIRPPAGIKPGTHSVRHLTATAMNAEGADLEEISDRLGHQNPESTRRYIHSIPDWRPGS